MPIIDRRVRQDIGIKAEGMQGNGGG